MILSITMKLPFRKYHGTGNDFVLFDGLSTTLPLERLLEPRLASWICNRHLGVGADGLLLLLAARSNTAQAQMRIINADGSEAEMCGNGIRCAAKALYDYNEDFASGIKDRISFDTGAGLIQCRLSLDEDCRVRSVRVEMGRPNLDRSALPMKGTGPFIEQPLNVADVELRFTAVSMGNPHLITFLEEEEDLHQLAAALGPQLERHPDFFHRTNVEFARLITEPGAPHIELWVWERGCGITLACGTGACATAVAAVVTNRCPAGVPITIDVPGGPLIVKVAEDRERVWLEGPAIEVFSGHLELPETLHDTPSS